jgi:hypothetical protein
MDHATKFSEHFVWSWLGMSWMFRLHMSCMLLNAYERFKPQPLWKRSIGGSELSNLDNNFIPHSLLLVGFLDFDPSTDFSA